MSVNVKASVWIFLRQGVTPYSLKTSCCKCSEVCLVWCLICPLISWVLNMEWKSGSVIYSRELYVMLSLLGNFSNAKSQNHGNLLIDMEKNYPREDVNENLNCVKQIVRGTLFPSQMVWLLCKQTPRFTLGNWSSLSPRKPSLNITLYMTGSNRFYEHSTYAWCDEHQTGF